MAANDLTWKTEKRKIGELIPYEHNPRQMTEKQNADLRKSLEKFGLAEIPAVQPDGTLVAGHQRIRILVELEGPDYEIDVRVPSRKLTDEEFREYLIRSNKNLGEWDMDVLANCFDVPDLIDWGFEESELDIGADFKPGEEDDQGKLDELEPKMVACPHCKKEFDLREQE